jgi:hypothetical protein
MGDAHADSRSQFMLVANVLVSGCDSAAEEMATILRLKLGEQFEQRPDRFRILSAPLA